VLLAEADDALILCTIIAFLIAGAIHEVEVVNHEADVLKTVALAGHPLGSHLLLLLNVVMHGLPLHSYPFLLHPVSIDLSNQVRVDLLLSGRVLFAIAHRVRE